jgi:CrcB protein
VTSLAIVMAVGALGGVASIARFLLDGAVAVRAGTAFPFGTLTVNLVGSFLLGVLVGAALGAPAYRLAGTAFLGSFTTFSTWAFESHRLAEDGRGRLGALNFAVSLALGVAGAWLGRLVGGGL